MKTYKNIIMCGAVALAMTACHFFENESPSSWTPEENYSSKAQIEKTLMGVYEVFGQDKFYRNRLACGYAGVNSDIECNKKYGDYATYKITASNPDLTTAKGGDPWGYFNLMIERCNLVIEGIDTYSYAAVGHSAKDSAELDYLKGEAYFLRAFAMLEMVRLWGDIPVNVTAYDGLDNNKLTQPKVDRNVAFEQIRSDFKKAASLMDWSANAAWAPAINDVRRANKGAALALLARNDLMYAGKAIRPTKLAPGVSDYKIDDNVDEATRKELYEEVLWACGLIMNEEGDKLKPNFEDVFKDICQDKVNYSEMEQLWVIPFADGAVGQVMNYMCSKFNSTTEGSITIGYLKNNYMYASQMSDIKSNSVNVIVPTMLFDYDEVDVRKWVTILPYSWGVASIGNKLPSLSLSNQEKTAQCLYQKLNSNPAQLYCGKYRLEWMARKNMGADDGIDWPIIRYADVLLMAAEAALYADGSKYGVDGQDCLNRVRNRAGLGDASAYNLPAIQEERKFEFCGEYLRKYDLMRWGILADKLIDAHERCEALRENQDIDKYTFYVTYKEDPTVVEDGAVDQYGKPMRGLVIDELYFEKSDDKPSGTMGATQKLNFKDKLVDTDYILYDYEKGADGINRHALWPIFNTNIGSSNNLLFNNYGY